MTGEFRRRDPVGQRYAAGNVPELLPQDLLQKNAMGLDQVVDRGCGGAAGGARRAQTLGC